MNFPSAQSPIGPPAKAPTFSFSFKFNELSRTIFTLDKFKIEVEVSIINKSLSVFLKKLSIIAILFQRIVEVNSGNFTTK